MSFTLVGTEQPTFRAHRDGMQNKVSMRGSVLSALVGACALRGLEKGYYSDIPKI